MDTNGPCEDGNKKDHTSFFKSWVEKLKNKFKGGYNSHAKLL